MIPSRSPKSMARTRQSSPCTAACSNKSWIPRYFTTVCTRGRGVSLVVLARPLAMDPNTR